MQLLAEGVHFVDGDFKDMIYKDTYKRFRRRIFEP